MLVFDAGRRNPTGVGKFSFVLEDPSIDMPKIIEADIATGSSPPSGVTYTLNRSLLGGVDAKDETAPPTSKASTLTKGASLSSPIYGNIASDAQAPGSAPTAKSSYVELDFSRSDESVGARPLPVKAAATTAYVELDLQKTAALGNMYSSDHSKQGSQRSIGRHQQGAPSPAKPAARHNSSGEHGSDVLSELDELVTSVGGQPGTTQHRPYVNTVDLVTSVAAARRESSHLEQVVPQQSHSLPRSTSKRTSESSDVPTTSPTSPSTTTQPYVNLSPAAIQAMAAESQPAYQNLTEAAGRRSSSASEPAYGNLTQPAKHPSYVNVDSFKKSAPGVIYDARLAFLSPL